MPESLWHTLDSRKQVLLPGKQTALGEIEVITGGVVYLRDRRGKSRQLTRNALDRHSLGPASADGAMPASRIRWKRQRAKESCDRIFDLHVSDSGRITR